MAALLGWRPAFNKQRPLTSKVGSLKILNYGQRGYENGLNYGRCGYWPK